MDSQGAFKLRNEPKAAEDVQITYKLLCDFNIFFAKDSICAAMRTEDGLLAITL